MLNRRSLESAARYALVGGRFGGHFGAPKSAFGPPHSTLGVPSRGSSRGTPGRAFQLRFVVWEPPGVPGESTFHNFRLGSVWGHFGYDFGRSCVYFGRSEPALGSL